MNMGNYFIVLNGLKAGDRIVVEGTNKVTRDGQVVVDAKNAQKQVGKPQGK